MGNSFVEVFIKISITEQCIRKYGISEIEKLMEERICGSGEDFLLGHHRNPKTGEYQFAIHGEIIKHSLCDEYVQDYVQKIFYILDNTMDNFYTLNDLTMSQNIRLI